MTKEELKEALSKLTEEQVQKIESELKTADTAEKITAAYKIIGLELTPEIAQEILNKTKTLSDDELENVAGGGFLTDITKTALAGVQGWFEADQMKKAVLFQTGLTILTTCVSKIEDR